LELEIKTHPSRIRRSFSHELSDLAQLTEKGRDLKATSTISTSLRLTLDGKSKLLGSDIVMFSGRMVLGLAGIGAYC